MCIIEYIVLWSVYCALFKGECVYIVIRNYLNTMYKYNFLVWSGLVGRLSNIFGHLFVGLRLIHIFAYFLVGLKDSDYRYIF